MMNVSSPPPGMSLDQWLTIEEFQRQSAQWHAEYYRRRTVQEQGIRQNLMNQGIAISPVEMLPLEPLPREIELLNLGQDIFAGVHRIIHRGQSNQASSVASTGGALTDINGQARQVPRARPRNLQESLGQSAAQASLTGTGNCGEHAAVAYALLNQHELPRGMHIWHVPLNLHPGEHPLQAIAPYTDHVFIAVGYPERPRNIVILDPWEVNATPIFAGDPDLVFPFLVGPRNAPQITPRAIRLPNDGRDYLAVGLGQIDVGAIRDIMDYTGDAVPASTYAGVYNMYQDLTMPAPTRSRYQTGPAWDAYFGFRNPQRPGSGQPGGSSRRPSGSSGQPRSSSRPPRSSSRRPSGSSRRPSGPWDMSGGAWGPAGGSPDEGVDPIREQWGIGRNVTVMRPRSDTGLVRGPAPVATPRTAGGPGEFAAYDLPLPPAGTPSSSRPLGYEVDPGGWIRLPDGTVLSPGGWISFGDDFIHAPTGAILHGDSGWIGQVGNIEQVAEVWDHLDPTATPHTPVPSATGLHMVPAQPGDQAVHIPVRPRTDSGAQAHAPAPVTHSGPGSPGKGKEPATDEAPAKGEAPAVLPWVPAAVPAATVEPSPSSPEGAGQDSDLSYFDQVVLALEINKELHRLDPRIAPVELSEVPELHGQLSGRRRLMPLRPRGEAIAQTIVNDAPVSFPGGSPSYSGPGGYSRDSYYVDPRDEGRPPVSSSRRRTGRSSQPSSGSVRRPGLLSYPSSGFSRRPIAQPYPPPGSSRQPAPFSDPVDVEMTDAPPPIRPLSRRPAPFYVATATVRPAGMPHEQWREIQRAQRRSERWHTRYYWQQGEYEAAIRGGRRVPMGEVLPPDMQPLEPLPEELGLLNLGHDIFGEVQRIIHGGQSNQASSVAATGGALTIRNGLARQVPRLPYRNTQEALGQSAAQASLTGTGNCGEHAALTYTLLNQHQLPPGMHIWHVPLNLRPGEDPLHAIAPYTDHVFIAVGYPHRPRNIVMLDPWELNATPIFAGDADFFFPFLVGPRNASSITPRAVRLPNDGRDYLAVGLGQIDVGAIRDIMDYTGEAVDASAYDGVYNMYPDLTMPAPVRTSYPPGLAWDAYFAYRHPRGRGSGQPGGSSRRPSGSSGQPRSSSRPPRSSSRRPSWSSGRPSSSSGRPDGPWGMSGGAWGPAGGSPDDGVDPIREQWGIGRDVTVMRPRSDTGLVRGPAPVPVPRAVGGPGEFAAYDLPLPPAGTPSSSRPLGYEVDPGGWIRLPDGTVLSPGGWISFGDDFIHAPTGAILYGDSGWIGQVGNIEQVAEVWDHLDPSAAAYTPVPSDTGLHMVPAQPGDETVHIPMRPRTTPTTTGTASEPSPTSPTPPPSHSQADRLAERGLAPLYILGQGDAPAHALTAVAPGESGRLVGHGRPAGSQELRNGLADALAADLRRPPPERRLWPVLTGLTAPGESAPLVSGGSAEAAVHALRTGSGSAASDWLVLAVAAPVLGLRLTVLTPDATPWTTGPDDGRPVVLFLQRDPAPHTARWAATEPAEAARQSRPAPAPAPSPSSPSALPGLATTSGPHRARAATTSGPAAPEVFFGSDPRPSRAR